MALPHCLASGYPRVFGPVAFTANFLAGFIVFSGPQFVNTFCHLKEHGYHLRFS
ncbi:MAG: hypothetical protein IPM93_24935 [Candidatus Obscuribacter sp.]|nr:hypothetical protein [Candidatus Obscuribacter sp.]